MGKTIDQLIILLITSSFFFFSACEKKPENQGEETADKEIKTIIKPVKVAQVKAEALEDSIEIAGTLTAGLKVKVATETGGTIEKILFGQGDRVKKDQVLARIGTNSISLEVQQAEAALAVAESNLKKIETGSRPEEISIAESKVEQARAALKELESNFKRVNDLYRTGAVSNRDFDAARTGVDTARAILESAKQQLELVKQGAREEDKEAARAGYKQAKSVLAMAKDRLRKSILRSPGDGVIAFRNVEEKEVVAPGMIITQVVDTEKMKVKLSLGERYIPVLARKKEFVFMVDAIPGQTFSGTLTFVSPTADPITRSFPLELSVEETDSRMADGMTVRVIFPLVDQRKSIKVHSSWLTEKNDQIGLFRVKNGKAEFKKVELGSYYEQKVEILSGLEEGDLVITTPAGLKHGDAISYE